MLKIRTGKAYSLRKYNITHTQIFHKLGNNENNNFFSIFQQKNALFSVKMFDHAQSNLSSI